MSFSVALLLALMLPVQNSSQIQNQYQLGSQAAPLFQSLQQHDQSQSVPRLHPWPRRFRLEANADDVFGIQQGNTCLALRVYHFERNDGRAPVLVKTVTCTPSTVFTQKAGHPPRPLYVPLKLDY
jgi:hypothetical protein